MKTISDEKLAEEAQVFIKKGASIGEAVKRTFKKRHIGFNPPLFGKICRLAKKIWGPHSEEQIRQYQEKLPSLF